jgi:predicted nuclease with TOPRIM domain
VNEIDIQKIFDEIEMLKKGNSELRNYTDHEVGLTRQEIRGDKDEQVEENKDMMTQIEENKSNINLHKEFLSKINGEIKQMMNVCDT